MAISNSFTVHGGYHLPLMQCNLDSLSQQFYYQEHGQAIANAFSEKRGGHRAQSPTSNPGWEKLERLFTAAAVLNDFFDPIVEKGERPLRESHLAKIGVACGALLSTTLGLDEETVLQRIIRRAWANNNQGMIQAVLKLVSHTASIQGDDRDQWLSHARQLFAQIAHEDIDLSLVMWANGVMVRTSIGIDVTSAEVKRKYIAEAKALGDRYEKTKASVAALKNEIVDLESQIRNSEEELGKQETALADADRHLAARLASDQGGIEFTLRRYFVRNRSAFQHLFVNPHIPDRKLSNARVACGVPASEKIIALFDLTVFGSAKDAVVFAESGIYFRTKEGALRLVYAGLASFEIHGNNDLTLVSKVRGGPTLKVSGMLGSSVAGSLQGVQRVLEQA